MKSFILPTSQKLRKAKLDHMLKAFDAKSFYPGATYDEKEVYPKFETSSFDPKGFINQLVARNIKRTIDVEKTQILAANSRFLKLERCYPEEK